MNPTYSALPPTPVMSGVGLSFPDLVDYARHAVHLLQTTGNTFVDLLEDGFKLWTAVSGRDLAGVLLAFSAGRQDVTAIIAAVKAEFGI